MGTRCAVGRVLPDGSYDMTYIHYDGYPEGVGKTLVNCAGGLQLDYLLKIGHIRSLSTCTEVFCGDDVDHIDFDDIKKNQKINGKAEQYRNLHEVANEFAYCDYVYVWCDNKWYVSHMRTNWADKVNWLTPFVLVTEVLDALDNGGFSWDQLEREHMFVVS